MIVIPGRRLGARLLAALVAVVTLALAPPAGAKDTVKISGRAYAFNHMDTFISGATIRVRELPRLAATTDANGDYTLAVPGNTDVTPYIEPPPGYNQIDLQTFHTRGADIENANFQTPADFEYNALAALLSVPVGPDGRPQQCVIVTTASARDVRGVDYETFHQRTPHGVAGARASTAPPLPGPTYFNENVIPDPSQSETSGDGGIIWTNVPAGTYRVMTTSPTARFASFLATCEPGRIVNANPPWGAYELAPGERPLGAGKVAAATGDVDVTRTGRRGRTVSLEVRAGEAVEVDALLHKAGRHIAHQDVRIVSSRDRTIRLPLRNHIRRGWARLDVRLTDAAGGRVLSHHRIRLPRRKGA